MKKVTLTFLISVVIIFCEIQHSLAQVPQTLNYQAIVRNNNNTLITNTKIGLQITVLKGSENGMAVYVETQNPTTNAYGMINVEFGGNANFNSILWGYSDYYLKTEVDVTGGSNYNILSVSQLLKIPYVFRSETSEGVVCMSQFQIEALPRITGFMVYNTTSNELVFFDGNVWKSILSQ